VLYHAFLSLYILNIYIYCLSKHRMVLPDIDTQFKASFCQAVYIFTDIIIKLKFLLIFQVLTLKCL